MDHDRGIPPDDGADLLFDRQVSRVLRLLVGRDRVDVGRLDELGELDGVLERVLVELADDEAGAFLPVIDAELVEGLDPLGGLLRVAVDSADLLLGLLLVLGLPHAHRCSLAAVPDAKPNCPILPG